MVRLCYDMSKKRLLAAEQRILASWEKVEPLRMVELQDDLHGLMANVLKKPEAYKLQVSDYRPDWLSSVLVPGRRLKQVVAIITFEDDRDRIETLSDAQAWLGESLGTVRDPVDVVAYSDLAQALQDAKLQALRRSADDELVPLAEKSLNGQAAER
jgi:hypothetical protein